METVTVDKVVADGDKREIHVGNLVYYFNNVDQVKELANDRREHTVMRDLLNDLVDSGDVANNPETIINRRYKRAKSVREL